MSLVQKAVIPVAGLGTRFLPATKSMPKEMVTLVDRPVIHYIVEEAVKAGIKEIIFITSQTKRAIEDYFDRNFELEYRLKQKKKLKELNQIQYISDLATFIYIRQKTPLGLGHAVLCAEKLIKNEPFVVFSGDDIIDSPTPAISKLIEVFKKYQDCILGVKDVPLYKTRRYGIIKGKKLLGRVYELEKIIEKPSPSKAPSRLAVAGRWLLTPEIFVYLKKTKPDKSGEIQLTDALKLYLKKRVLYAYHMEGDWYDCGDKVEFLKAVVNFSLKRSEFNAELKKYFQNKLRSKR